MTQSDRILAALRAAGPSGVATTDFLLPDVIDGGTPILRVPSRVDELRKAGHRITTHREDNGTARYVLAGPPLAGCEPAGVAASKAPELSTGVDAPVGEPAPLFATDDAPHRPASPYDVWSDAA